MDKQVRCEEFANQFNLMEAGQGSGNSRGNATVDAGRRNDQG